MENVLAFLTDQADKISEHAVHHGVVIVTFFLIGSVAGVIVHRWKQARYGMRVTVRVCWVEKEDGFPRPILMDKVLVSGTALEMTGGKDLAAALVRSARRTRDGKMLNGRTWKPATAKHVLDHVGYRILRMFGSGTIARAMEDKDVTRGEFALAAFKRGREVSVIMARQKDLGPFMSPAANRDVLGDDDERREMEQLASIFTGISKECGTMVVLYM